MWRPVDCRILNYSSMGSKYLSKLSFISLIIPISLFFVTISTTYSHNVNNNLNSIAEDYVLCRLCGADLADAKHIINHLSPEATIIVNQTLFEHKEVKVQLLSNPLGIKFYSISFSNSKCSAVHNWQQNFSWYPGYAWKPCICKHCRTHHGWLFEPIETTNTNTNPPSDKGFFVLKLHNLLSEKFADSLIVVPKSYIH